MLVEASRGTSMSANPRDISDAELTAILEGLLSILSAGLTPAWQQIMIFSGFHYGEVNRACEVHWLAQGKVLNAGIAAHHLGGHSEHAVSIAYDELS